MEGKMVTWEDLQEFRMQLLDDIKRILERDSVPKAESREWIKGAEVKRILGICASSLQNLRVNGQLRPTKIGGTWYYDPQEVYSLFGKKK